MPFFKGLYFALFAPFRRLTPPLSAVPVEAGFPSPADDYVERPLGLNELMVRWPVRKHIQ